MLKVVDVDTMRLADAETIRGGVLSTTLMRRAAESLYYSYPVNGEIALICGLGNNGGDGFALAEIMIDNGLMPCIFSFHGKRSADNKYYYDRLISKGAVIRLLDNETPNLKGYDIIYDCIFGTGMVRDVDGIYKDIIEEINNSGAYIIAADIASGLNGDNGIVQGIAVRADLTISIGAIKCGHLLNDGIDNTGKLINYDIGISVDKHYNLIENSDLREFFPPRKRNVHKNSSGRLLIIGGCTEYMGAVLLAESGAAALRMGAGLNCIAVPSSYSNAIIERITMSTVKPVPDINGSMVYDAKFLDELIKGYRALAIGMGIGKGKDILKFIKHLLNKDINMLIDADAINALSSDVEILKGKKAKVVLTPHPKEFSRLINLTVEEILLNPVRLAVKFAKEYGVVLLLKGATTVVTDGQEVYFINKGAPNMAKGGSGDLLSGIIGGLMARGIDNLRAAYSGSYIAGRAGELAGVKIGEYSALPIDTVNCIPEVIKEIINN